MTKKYINELSFEIIGAAINVHRQIGPGLLESVYEQCFCEELSIRGLKYVSQARVPIIYNNKELQADLKLDVMVENTIICELKAIETLLPVHLAQLVSYMKLLQKPKGLLINFHTDNVSKNMKYYVNEYFKELPEE